MGSLLASIKAAKHVFIIGNGGSHANSTHIVNDLLMCRIKAFTLDAASLTASANDHGFETVFSRWIDVVGERGDLLIALSGSGKSPNILNAIALAEKKGMMVERVFGAPRLDMQMAEEEQIFLGHQIMRSLCTK